MYWQGNYKILACLNLEIRPYEHNIGHSKFTCQVIYSSQRAVLYAGWELVFRLPITAAD
jgi:hypothetical protein